MTKEEAIETIKDICLTTEQLTRIEKALECLLSHPSLPSNLDEAAKEYNRNYIPFDQCDRRDIIHTFKAGAEWMAQQGETIFDTINMDGQGQRWLSDNLLQGDYDCGEEVIIQIRKKQ